MQERIKQRLEVLKGEYETGQKALADQEARTAELRHTLLRISGAIQVLEEMIKEEPEKAK